MQIRFNAIQRITHVSESKKSFQAHTTLKSTPLGLIEVVYSVVPSTKEKCLQVNTLSKKAEEKLPFLKLLASVPIAKPRFWHNIAATLHHQASAHAPRWVIAMGGTPYSDWRRPSLEVVKVTPMQPGSIVTFQHDWLQREQHPELFTEIETDLKALQTEWEQRFSKQFE